MRASVRHAITLLVVFGAFDLGCSASGVPDDLGGPAPSAPSASTPPRSGNGGGSDAGTFDVGGSGGGSCARRVTTDVPASADTILIGGASSSPAWCNGANYAGDYPLLNVGVGIHSVGAFRFALPAGIASSIASAPTTTTMELILERAPTGAQCGSSPCPQACGTLSAFGMRSDWEEGATTFSPYSGADWCRRDAGEGAPEWQKQGATGPLDSGAAAGSAAICDGLDHASTPQATIHVLLEPSALGSWIDASGNLTIRVEPGSGGVFTAASRENGAIAGPILRVTFCGP